MMGWYGVPGSMQWLGWFSPLAMLLFWAGIVGLFVWLAGAVARRPSAAREQTETALDVLKRRYAAGEIGQ